LSPGLSPAGSRWDDNFPTFFDEIYNKPEEDVLSSGLP
jgi:hypothetical protein